MTREEAIQFCIDRNQMHLRRAEKFSMENDIIEDEVSRIKYNSLLDLASKYKDIAEMLQEGKR